MSYFHKRGKIFLNTQNNNAKHYSKYSTCINSFNSKESYEVIS